MILAGYTYCAIASFSLLHRLPDPSAAFSQNFSTPDRTSNNILPGLTNFPATVRWLVSRQVEYSEDDGEDDEDNHTLLPLQDQRDALAGIHEHATEVPSFAGLSLRENQFVGFNGRCNKRVDTCYAFWVGASLDVGYHIRSMKYLLILCSLWVSFNS
jgi:geranylgeranyl transferase type-1 subunit beta